MPPEPPAASAQPRLRRLPGRSPSLRLSRATPTARLWMDDGQLIQETVRSYTQEIQRFAFADLQAIQVRRTPRGMVYNIVLAALLALALFITWSSWIINDRNSVFTGQRLVVLASVATPFLLLLLVNTLRGPTCRTVLLTALGPQPLYSLSRMRPAMRALDTIVDHTEAVQGALPPEEIAQQVDRAQQAQQAQRTQRPLTPPPSTPSAPLPGYHY